MEDNVEQAKNMKLLLCAFEQLSGLKINFHKNVIFSYGIAKDKEGEFSQIFGCDMGLYPFIYLDIPMHHRKLQIGRRWRGFRKKLSCWKG